MEIDLSAIASSEKFRTWLGVSSNQDINFKLLGHGEYNLNYRFTHPISGDELVLRIPMGSQMHLDNQVRYEYQALLQLMPSGRTPKPLYIDDTKADFEYGFLVMDFLSGRSLVYETDLPFAAACLADIHNLEAPAGSHLISPKNPLSAILDECHAMFKHFNDSELASPEIKDMISSLLVFGQNIIDRSVCIDERCIINTELNSGNFLVNDDGATYLIDWEKPLLGSPGQDLGHFLAPTTTLWKTDTLLSADDIRHFLEIYCRSSKRFDDVLMLHDTTMPYLRMNCLRGVTWCAMAWVEYQQPDRLLRDDFTFEKIKFYITPEFLEKLRKDYLCV